MTSPKPDSLTWFKLNVSRQQAHLSLLSWDAQTLDQQLMLHAWSNPDGTYAVPMRTLRTICSLHQKDAEGLYNELIASERWERSEDRKTIANVMLRELGTVAGAKIEKLVKAGIASGIARRSKAPKPRKQRKNAPKKARAKKPVPAATEQMLNTCSDSRDSVPDARESGAHASVNEPRNSLQGNAPNICSTHAEQIRELPSSSLTTFENEEEGSRAGTACPAATAPAASHAGGAAVAVALSTAPAKSRPGDPGFLLQMHAVSRLAEVEVPPDFGVGDVASVVGILRAAAPGVDVERPLYRICAAWQRRGDASSHLAVIAEIRAVLLGADGRAGLIPIECAARSLALALHGSLIMPDLVSPLVLRAIARVVALTVALDDPHAMGRSVLVAGEFERGRRKASDAWISGDPSPTERPLPLSTAGERRQAQSAAHAHV